MTSRSSKFRRLTEQERAVLEFLLEAPFPGRDEIRQQLDAALARTVDDEGSLQFKISSGAEAHVQDAFPVQAEMIDDDGIPVFAELYVVDCILRELDIWKGDLSKLIKSVTASDLRLVRPDEVISINDLLRKKNESKD